MAAQAVKHEAFDLHPVESSNIAAIGYRPHERNLRVQFRSGGLYQFGSFAPTDYKAFTDASSKGKHFGQHIRGNYPTTHVNKVELGDVLTQGRKVFTGFRGGSKLRKHIVEQTGKHDFSKLTQADLQRLHKRFNS
jgi:hypothetical protein